MEKKLEEGTKFSLEYEIYRCILHTFWPHLPEECQREILGYALRWIPRNAMECHIHVQRYLRCTLRRHATTYTWPDAPSAPERLFSFSSQCFTLALDWDALARQLAPTHAKLADDFFFFLRCIYGQQLVLSAEEDGGRHVQADNTNDPKHQRKKRNVVRKCRHPLLYLCLSIKYGNLAMVHDLLMRIKEDQSTYAAAMMFAAQYGRLSVLKLLMCHWTGAMDYNIPFHVAAQHGHVSILAHLIDETTVVTPIEPAAHQNYALRWAAARGYLDVIEFLMTLADQQQQPREPQGLSPTRTRILRQGKRINPAAKNNEALREAVAHDQEHVVQYLVSLPSVYGIDSPSGHVYLEQRSNVDSESNPS